MTFVIQNGLTGWCDTGGESGLAALIAGVEYRRNAELF
jgi:hypothetical protein